MAPTTDMKCPARPCKGCKATISAQARGPGRPREFCSRSCRRAYFHSQEKDELQRKRAAERAEARERELFKLEQWHHGRAEAKRRAKQRARES